MFTGTTQLVTPIIGKQLFLDGNQSSRKEIKLEAAESVKKLETDKTNGKEKPEPFIMNECTIAALTEHGSNFNLSDETVPPNVFAWKRLKCKQKRIAPNPWDKGSKRKVVSMCVTDDLYDWLKNNSSSTMRR